MIKSAIYDNKVLLFQWMMGQQKKKLRTCITSWSSMGVQELPEPDVLWCKEGGNYVNVNIQCFTIRRVNMYVFILNNT